MIHIRFLDDLRLQHSWLSIGVFDGVHRGHQELIGALSEGARSERSTSVVLTFWPHPAVVLGRGELKALTTPDERAELLGSFGVDYVVTHTFDPQVAALSAAEFMSRVQNHLGVRHLLMGYDFALGHGREGNAARLAELGREMNFTTQVVEAVSDESGVISSTEIRKLVSVGDVAEAAKLLGHTYAIQGAVVRGDGRGRMMDFPTANLDYPREKVIPANGIYACWALVAGQKHKAAVNIGINPTFTPARQMPSVEAYLLDFDPSKPESVCQVYIRPSGG